MTGKTKNKKKKSRIQSGTVKKKQIREKVIEERIKDPDITQSEMARKLDVSRGSIRSALNHNGVKLILQEAEERLNRQLVEIRDEAVVQLKDFVKGFQIVINPEGGPEKKTIPANVQASMIKFALEGVMNKSSEPDPTEIEFETVINDAGIISQTVKKNYGNKRGRRKADDAEEAEEWGDDG